MANKNTFVLRINYADIFNALSDKQAGRLIKATLKYVAAGDIPESFDDGKLEMAFMFIKQDIDYDKSKYEKSCEQWQKNGQKGGRPPSNKTKKTKLVNLEPKKPNVTKPNLSECVVVVDSEGDKGTTLTTLPQESPAEESFRRFWDRYPKKSTKKDSFDWWKKNKSKWEDAISGLDWYAESNRVKNGYALDAIRYLKNEVWADDPKSYNTGKKDLAGTFEQVMDGIHAEQESENG